MGVRKYAILETYKNFYGYRYIFNITLEFNLSSHHCRRKTLFYSNKKESIKYHEFLHGSFKTFSPEFGERS